MGVLVAPSTALAIAPPSVGVSPSSPSQAADWTFTFSATPDPLDTLVGFEGGLTDSATGEPTTPVSPPFAASGLAEGLHYFRVRAVQQDPLAGTTNASGYATATIRVDRTPPARPTAVFVPSRPNGTNGWYRSLDDRLVLLRPVRCRVPRSGHHHGPSRRRRPPGGDRRRRQRQPDGGPRRAFDFDNGAPAPGHRQPVERGARGGGAGLPVGRT